MGKITGEASCLKEVRKSSYGRALRLRCAAKQECLTHELSREWLGVTGDSHVVHVEYQRSAARSVSYLAKYMVKAQTEWDELERRGFKRRWVCSRNFPSPARMRLRGSAGVGQRESVWRTTNGRVRTEPADRLAAMAGLFREAERNVRCENIEKVGEDLGKPYRLKALQKQVARKVELHDSPV